LIDRFFFIAFLGGEELILNTISLRKHPAVMG
jgi:hypothetical protein